MCVCVCVCVCVVEGLSGCTCAEQGPDVSSSQRV